MKLIDIVNQLPRALAHRFDSTFWVNNANKVLQDLEMKGDIPRVKDTFYLLVEEGVCSYKLPSFVKKVLNVLENPYTSEYSLQQDRIILDIAETDLGATTIPVTFQSVNNELIGIEFYILEKEATPLFKDLVLVESITGKSFDIQKLNVGEEVVPVGETRFVRVSTDVIDINEGLVLTNSVVPIEYTKSFQQAEDMLSDILEDTDIHQVLAEGLWYYALKRVDPDGTESGAATQRGSYELEKRSWFNRRTRGLFKQKTRFGV